MVNVEVVREFLLWSAVVNYTVLAVWFVGMVSARDAVYELYGRWFRLSAERFDALNYSLMGLYKIGILLLNVVPYIALRIVT